MSDDNDNLPAGAPYWTLRRQIRDARRYLRDADREMAHALDRRTTPSMTRVRAEVEAARWMVAKVLETIYVVDTVRRREAKKP